MTIHFPPLGGSGLRDRDTIWLGGQEIDIDQIRSGWMTWTPSYTNLTVGNGTVVSRYAEVGKLTVCWYELILGSTSSIGTNPQISTPVTAHGSYTAARHMLNTAFFLDSGTASYVGVVRLEDADNFSLGVLVASATYLTQGSVNATAPMTWTTSDVLTFTAVYESA